jgi:hypothetical protein
MDTYSSKARKDIENDINYLTDTDTTFDLLRYYDPILILIPKKGKRLDTRQYNGFEAAKRLNPKYLESAKISILNEYATLLDHLHIFEDQLYQLAKDRLKNNGTSTKNSEGAAD